jgi:hypothetical protein
LSWASAAMSKPIPTAPSNLPRGTAPCAAGP